MINFKRLIFLLLVATSCSSKGQLQFEADITNSLTEISAAETIVGSDLLWTIEDSGNENRLIGLNSDGHIEKSIYIANAKNKDWEDLTSNNQGNIHIGDFGNNNQKRKKFKILKVAHNQLSNDTADAEIIKFKLPEDKKSKDFEGFFIYDDVFYLFSKTKKNINVFSVPNEAGDHIATFVSGYKLKGKDTRITSADISPDGKTVVLLNHDKLWKLTNFKGDKFFSGDIEAIDFGHNSQKEGINFKTSSEVIITDERKGSEGGNIYSLDLTKN